MSLRYFRTPVALKTGFGLSPERSYLFIFLLLAAADLEFGSQHQSLYLCCGYSRFNSFQILEFHPSHEQRLEFRDEGTQTVVLIAYDDTEFLAVSR